MSLQPSLASVTESPARRAEHHPRPALTLIWCQEQPSDNHFTSRDRIALLGWEKDARRFGVTRVAIERPDPDLACPEVGDFALIYDETSEWARWAVAREAGTYLLWSPSSGETLGRYTTIAAALTRIGTADC